MRIGCLYFWLFPSLPPSAHACVGREAGWQACRRTGLLRHLTCRSCLSGARSAKRVLRHTPHPAQRRSPAAKRRVVGSSGRASLPRFLVARQESGAAAGPKPGLCPQRHNRINNRSNRNQPIRAITAPNTCAFPASATKATTPLRCAVTCISIFMASMTAITSPS